MDPNATWQMLCEYLQALHQHPDDEEIRTNVIELLGALTHWLSRGGFPPNLNEEERSGLRYTRVSGIVSARSWHTLRHV